MSTIIKSTEFKPEMITYSEPKQLNGGRGKTVYISYGEYGHYSLQTPVMKLPFGLSIDDRQEVPKYALDLSFRGIETDPKLEKFYNSLDKMDNKLVDDAVKHSMEWFKKKKSSKEVMSNLYNPIIRLSKDKETGEKKDKTEWHNVMLFRQQAELAEKYVKKGRAIQLLKIIKEVFR